MRTQTGNAESRAARRFGDERGSVMVIAVVFVLVFTIMGVALYWLVTSQTRATETERTDVKAFNVAEAGIDAGMLSLKLAWPRKAGATATVDEALLRQSLRDLNPGLWLPTEDGELDPTDFLQVHLYDNVDPETGETTVVADMNAPAWDSNRDGKMFVDSTSNVDNDRHRILVLAECQKWELTFPATLALWAGVVDSNGQGLEIKIEDGTPPIYYDVHDAQHKGLDPNPPDQVLAAPSTDFESVVSTATRLALLRIAQDERTYFSGADAAAAASAFLASGQANGKVVYVKSDTAVELAGDTQVGTVDEPVVVVIDNGDNVCDNVWDFRGTGDFYGIMVVVGNSILRGTSGMHGAMYVSGMLSNQGNGQCGEINYNQKCIDNINGQYTISVNIVPNTWEEYTLPVAAN
jgi:hypothetical protein